MVSGGTPVTWAMARDAFAPGDAAQGDAVVEWAIATGRFTVDVDSTITPDSVLRPLAPAGPTATIRI